MGSKLIKGLACLSVIVVIAVVLGGVQAWAGCSYSKTSSSATCCGWKTTSSNYTYCVLWCTGSEICTNVISGLGGNIVNGCTPGLDCPVTSCAAYGTVPTDTSFGSCTTDLGYLNPTCGIEGIAVCTNPDHHFNAQGTPYTLSGFENSIGDVTTCDKKGKCTNDLTLEPSDTSNICINHNWHFVTFTAGTFKAEACLCPGGYANRSSSDSTQVCCATADRTEANTCSTLYGTGVSAGTPTCMRALCTVDLSQYNANSSSLAYNCLGPPAPITCGGVTGELCP